MAKINGPKRNPGIMAGFDKAALRRHVETADQRRAPTQEELAAGYGADADIVACARDYPASVDDIIEGICAQDPRFLDQGRKLLKQLLRSNAKGSPDIARKRRGRGAGRPETGSVPEGPDGNAVASERVPEQIASPPPTAGVGTPLFDAADYEDANVYGD